MTAKFLPSGTTGTGTGSFTLKYSRPQCSPPSVASSGPFFTMFRAPRSTGSIRSECFPLCATSSTTPTAPFFVNPAGICPTAVDSKSSEMIGFGAGVSAKAAETVRVARATAKWEKEEVMVGELSGQGGRF